MEKIYYDSYEQRIRTTVWAEKNLDGNAEIHKYVRGVYIDDIFGMDEDETKLIISAESFPSLFACAGVSSLKDLFEFWGKENSVRSGYEQIKAWIEKTGVGYEEETI